MAKTYATTGPSTSPKDSVRFLIRDHIPEKMKLTDEEINWLISEEGDIYMAAAAACDQLQERALTSKTVGDTSLSFSSGQYKDLAARLRAKSLANSGAGPWSATTPTTIYDQDPYWWLGIHDNPDAPSPGRKLEPKVITDP